jgi:hypothetical protein
MQHSAYYQNLQKCVRICPYMTRGNRTHYNIRERESSQHKKTRNILVSFVDPRDKASVKALLKTCKGKANALDFGRRKDKSALCECGRPHKQSWAIRRRMDSLKWRECCSDGWGQRICEPCDTVLLSECSHVEAHQFWENLRKCNAKHWIVIEGLLLLTSSKLTRFCLVSAKFAETSFD